MTENNDNQQQTAWAAMTEEERRQIKTDPVLEPEDFK